MVEFGISSAIRESGDGLGLGLGFWVMVLE